MIRMAWVPFLPRNLRCPPRIGIETYGASALGNCRRCGQTWTFTPAVVTWIRYSENQGGSWVASRRSRASTARFHTAVTMTQGFSRVSCR